MIIPNIWENKKCSKPPTSYVVVEVSAQSIQKNAPLPGTQRFLGFVQPKSQPAVGIILVSYLFVILLYSLVFYCYDVKECMKSIDETSHNLSLNRKKDGEKNE